MRKSFVHRCNIIMDKLEERNEKKGDETMSTDNKF